MLLLSPSIAKQKAPDSKVAGEPNVFIFLNCQSGNMWFMVVRNDSAGLEASGPILQGLNSSRF